MIPHNKPYISKNAYKAIKQTLEGGWINYSDISHRLEDKLSNLIYNQIGFTTLVTSGTSALYLALKSLDIKVGDEVVIPSYTCTALLNAVNLIGACAVIVDVSKKNLSFTKKVLKPFISDRTKAIIVVHTFGIPCEVEEIKTFNIPIVEDCSQALGSRFKDGSFVGSKGAVSVFSFYATKMITGGIGGAIASQNENINSFIKDYINFDYPDVYKNRFNFQISDINSAMILSSFDELDKLLKKKQDIAKEYLKSIDSKYAKINGFNHYRFLLEFNKDYDLVNFKKYLESKEIRTIIPIENFELLHNYLGLDKNNYPNAEYLSNHILSLPIFPMLKKYEIKYIRRNIDDYFSSSKCLQPLAWAYPQDTVV